MAEEQAVVVVRRPWEGGMRRRVAEERQEAVRQAVRQNTDRRVGVAAAAAGEEDTL